ncbi:hypothetical protein Rmet_2611 [Cupriavidus metallidurans CH34]|uniref:Uncharacterized protein n=1 Tax=Cupriavidus metallidurans (strain ATCC 43123 / DSM 2839 / NBRC 102507 / CH34) TaxID=266264 RepID=Q1LK38_CUPMC|nr:hypothetical protein Rmet_2611 [Cupriavidus metallidurans CH34]
MTKPGWPSTTPRPACSRTRCTRRSPCIANTAAWCPNSHHATISGACCRYCSRYWTMQAARARTSTPSLTRRAPDLPARCWWAHRWPMRWASRSVCR